MSITSSWFRVGKVTVTKNSKQVTGDKTNWLTHLSPIGVGDIFTVDFDRYYEVVKITNDTQLELDRPFAGNTAANSAYAIIRTGSSSYSARTAAAVQKSLNWYQSQLLPLEHLMSVDGDVEYLMPDGTTVTMWSIAKQQKLTQTIITDAQDAIDKANEAHNSLEADIDLIYDSARQAKADADRAHDEADRGETARAGAESARDTANSHKSAAQTAKTQTEAARDAANTHKNTAGTYKTQAEAAKNAAITAQGKSETAQGLSETAQGKSETAQAASEAARDTANTYKNQAGTYKSQAETAKNAAVAAQGKAEDAQDATAILKNQANSAKVAAESARDTANTHKNTANTYKGQAETAKNAAVAAQGKAETAQGKSETAQGLSEDAQAASEAARDKALEYRNTANTYKGQAEAAKNAAVTAQGKSETAQAASEAAHDATNTHKVAAEAAKVAAQTARADTLAAKDETILAQEAAEYARDQAQTHKDDAQTAKTQTEAARDSANSHKNTANSAKVAAEAARDKSLEYRNTAGTYKSQAETAKNAAVVAQGKAETAQGLSEDAQLASETAQTASEAARDTANSHKNAAGTYKTQAETAKAGAQAAEAKALEYKNSAHTAKSDSQKAQTASEAARDLSNTYKNQANTANAGAQTAQGLAEDARDAANSHKTAAKASEDAAGLSAGRSETAESGAISAKQASETARDQSVAARNASQGYRNEASAFSDDAEAWAAKAEHNANRTFVSGGFWYPKTKEYPDVSDVQIDTIFIITMSERGEKYTFTSGPLKGRLTVAGDQMMFDVPSRTWSLNETGISGGAVTSIQTKYGGAEFGPSINLTMAKLGGLEEPEITNLLIPKANISYVDQQIESVRNSYNFIGTCDNKIQDNSGTRDMYLILCPYESGGFAGRIITSRRSGNTRMDCIDIQAVKTTTAGNNGSYHLRWDTTQSDNTKAIVIVKYNNVEHLAVVTRGVGQYQRPQKGIFYTAGNTSFRPVMVMADHASIGTERAVTVNHASYGGHWGYSHIKVPTLISTEAQSTNNAALTRRDFVVGELAKKLDNRANAVSASKWLTSRTFALTGGVSGSVTLDGSSNVSMNVTVAKDSHGHTIGKIDNLQNILDSKFAKSGGTVTGSTTFDGGNNTTVTVKCNDSGQAIVEARGDGQGTGIFYAGQSTTHGGGFLYNGDGNPAYTDAPDSDAIVFYRRSSSKNYWVFKYEQNSNNVYYRGLIYVNNDKRVYAQDYHPYADKWTSARTLTLGGDVTGNVTFDGSANFTLNVSIKDNSHAHTISNITNLQQSLDAKANVNGAQTLSGVKTLRDGLDIGDESAGVRYNAQRKSLQFVFEATA